MITLDPRPTPADAGVVRDISRPCLVKVQDPTGRHVYFAEPRIAAQTRVLQQGDVVQQHIVTLPGGTEMRAPPAWVTECPDGIVIPLRPVAEMVG